MSSSVFLILNISCFFSRMFCWLLFGFDQNPLNWHISRKSSRKGSANIIKFKCPQWILNHLSSCILRSEFPSNQKERRRRLWNYVKMHERWTSCAHGTLNPAASFFYDDHSSPGFLCWCFVNLMPFFAQCATSHWTSSFLSLFFSYLLALLVAISFSFVRQSLSVFPPVWITVISI